MLNIYDTENQSHTSYEVVSKVKKSFYPQLYLKKASSEEKLNKIELKRLATDKYQFYLEIDPNNSLTFNVGRFNISIPDNFSNELFTVNRLRKK